MRSCEKTPSYLIPALCLGLLAVAAAPVSAQLVINEFVVDHTGTNTYKFIEVFGSPSTDYSAYTLLEIEGDGTSGPGLVDDAVFTVGATDANGLWVAGYDSAGGGGNVLENGTLTLLLVRNFTGATGDDIDGNDDGVIDNPLWDQIVDDVGLPDGGAADRTYSTTDLGDGFDGSPFQPGGASRIPDGADTDTSADWIRNTFDGEGLPCFPFCGGAGDPTAPGEAFNTVGQHNRMSCAPLVITDSTLDASRTFQTCGALTLGPNVSLLPPGELRFFAGQQVSIVDGLDVEADLEAGTCGHDLCAQGDSLGATCMPCVTAICRVDPYCCDTAWDGPCVARVATPCGFVCP